MAKTVCVRIAVAIYAQFDDWAYLGPADTAIDVKRAKKQVPPGARMSIIVAHCPAPIPDVAPPEISAEVEP